MLLAVSTEASRSPVQLASCVNFSCLTIGGSETAEINDFLECFVARGGYLFSCPVIRSAYAFLEDSPSSTITGIDVSPQTHSSLPECSQVIQVHSVAKLRTNASNDPLSICSF